VLEHLNKAFGEKFKPSPVLDEKVKKKNSTPTLQNRATPSHDKEVI